MSDSEAACSLSSGLSVFILLLSFFLLLVDQFVIASETPSLFFFTVFVVLGSDRLRMFFCQSSAEKKTKLRQEGMCGQMEVS